MVREDGTGGLRERLYFARLLLDELEAGVAGNDSRARLLALRTAVLFHLYSLPVGLVRQAGRRYQVDGVDGLMSLEALAGAFRDAGVEAPEVVLVESARRDGRDPLAWLDAQMREALGAAALARRPEPPGEHDGLGLRAEDPYEPLAEGDLARLRECLQRLDRLRRECEPHGEEW